VLKGFAFIDVETTGLNPKDNQIIEIAVNVTDMRLKSIYNHQWYVKLDASRELPENITELTGITTDVLNKRGVPEASLHDFLPRALSDRIVVAHNASFDLAYIAPFYRPSVFICTKALAHFTEPEEKTSLKAVCERHGIKMERHHTALSDAVACKNVLKVLTDKYGFKPQYFNAIVEEPERELYYVPVNAELVTSQQVAKV
jgi:DNA polymerase III epsilon subunit-like protein